MTALSSGAIRRRYLALIALRWLPTGFLIPVLVLLMLSRGLSLTEIGLAFSAQGFVVLALELPTGGLSDAIGRRPVLLLSGVLALVSLGLLFVADSVGLLALAMVIQGVYRALDSGPLEAWFVDSALAADPSTKIDRGLGAGSSVLSLAIAGGAILSGGLVALDPIDAVPGLALPVLVAIALHVVYLVAIAALLVEPPRSTASDHRGVAAPRGVRAVPGVVAAGLRLVGSSRVLLTLVSVELFWGFSMVAFESLFPVRLSEVVGRPDDAAALMGPVSSAAWFAAAAGAGAIGAVSARIGVATAAGALRIAQGIGIVGMGLLAGPVGVVAAYLACYVAHGASNPLHTTLLHREVDSRHRTTILSMNSMVSQPAGAIGAIVLSALADGTSLATTMVVAGALCAVAAPLYLPALRAERRRATQGPGRPVEPAVAGAEVSDSPV